MHTEYRMLTFFKTPFQEKRIFEKSAQIQIEATLMDIGHLFLIYDIFYIERYINKGYIF